MIASTPYLACCVQRSLKHVLCRITSLHEITDGQVNGIDEKTLRRSDDKACSKMAIHVVSPQATRNHIGPEEMVIVAVICSGGVAALNDRLVARKNLRDLFQQRSNGISDAWGCFGIALN